MKWIFFLITYQKFTKKQKWIINVYLSTGTLGQIWNLLKNISLFSRFVEHNKVVVTFCVNFQRNLALRKWYSYSPPLFKVYFYFIHQRFHENFLIFHRSLIRLALKWLEASKIYASSTADTANQRTNNFPTTIWRFFQPHWFRGMYAEKEEDCVRALAVRLLSVGQFQSILRRWT